MGLVSKHTHLEYCVIVNFFFINLYLHVINCILVSGNPSISILTCQKKLVFYLENMSLDLSI